MGENGLTRHLRAAAALSFAVLVASCGGTRRDAAPVVMNGAAPGGIEAAPLPPSGIGRRRGAKPPPSPTGPGKTSRRASRAVGGLSRARVRRHEAGDHRGQQSDPAGIQDRDRPAARHSRRREPHTPPAAAGGSGEAAAPPPERAAAAGRPGKAPEIIPLDEPAPAPRKSAEAPAISFPPPAVRRRKCVAGQTVSTRRRAGRAAAEPAEKEVASAEAERAAEPRRAVSMAGARARSRRLRRDKGGRPECRDQHRRLARRTGPRRRFRRRRLCRQRDPRLRQSRAREASERVDFSLRPSRFAARQARRHGQPRPSHREGRRYWRGQRAAAAFRAASRQESGRSARVSWAAGANAGGGAKGGAGLNAGTRVAPPQSSALGGPGRDPSRDRAATISTGCGRGRSRSTASRPMSCRRLPGKRILHLQCHFGADSLKLVQRGAAEIVGVDFSPPAIAAARRLAQEMGLAERARFVEADVYDAPARRSRAARVRSGLRDLGRDLLAAGHPGGGRKSSRRCCGPAARFTSPMPIPPRASWTTPAARRTACPAFSRRISRVIRSSIPRSGTTSIPMAKFTHPTSHTWVHPLGDTVTGLIEAGMRLDWLHEHDGRALADVRDPGEGRGRSLSLAGQALAAARVLADGDAKLSRRRVAGTDQPSDLPRRPARSWMNCQATRPEREPRVIDHSLASARSRSSGRSSP